MRKQQFKSGNRQNNSIEKYLEEIGVFTPLPPAEEIELTCRVRKGEAFVLDKLVKANLRFVISIANQYQGQGLPLEDLISEGNLGLMKAAQRFDETRDLNLFLMRFGGSGSLSYRLWQSSPVWYVCH